MYRSTSAPVRGFRTGFSKVTQLLSKELFYFLDEANRKLVVFSDSREEAASLANGVERSHYRDLVREALYDELTLEAVGRPLLLADLTDDPSSFANAVQLRPDLSMLKAALGCAWARKGNLPQALTQLRPAVTANPFDRDRAVNPVVRG